MTDDRPESAEPRLTPKQRLAIPRQTMPTRPADERRGTFEEVSLGLPILSAHQEAERCLSCAHPQCMHGCPVGVKVREFVELVRQGDFLGAAAKIREDNVLPAITGRVCPQEHQCEGACILGKRGESLGIGYLERFVADFEQEHGGPVHPPRVSPTGRRVAIIGSGPAGLSAAGDLIRRGHGVTIFEALHEPGGVLIYGIPEFRLPKQIVRREIANLKAIGVQIETNVVIGRTLTIDDLFHREGFDAVFIATGAGLPKFLGIPGEHLAGVYSANEFLTRVNLLRANEFPQFDEPVYDCRGRVVGVIGGGNTALDAVRTALRLGARRALLIYRRGQAHMPARQEEVAHALEEGVELWPFTAPVEFLAGPEGNLASARCLHTQLAAEPQHGRPQVIPLDGSEFVLPLDVAIVALGTGANPLVQSTTPELATDGHGYIKADSETMATSYRGVFAGGDVVSGGATVIRAMGAGRRAARAIDDYLRRLPAQTTHASGTRFSAEP
jgi:glutamate synthase (NADPH/NADH) small chain